jgi:cytochrome c oxidase subunit 3
VRAAQLKQIGMLKLMILLTMLCAFGFMGVKAVEYNSKWKHGLLWAGQYDPHHEEHGETSHEAVEEGQAAEAHEAMAEESVEETVPAQPAADPDRSTIAPAAEGPAGLAAPAAAAADEHEIEIEPANAQIYFSIYFLLTGLHGIHVLGGIGAFFWLFLCARRGYFDSGHFTRVDMVALYWHLVDLIWIYLFLLLYLID